MYKELLKFSNKIQTTQIKMDKRLEQTFLQRSHINGQYLSNLVLYCLSYMLKNKENLCFSDYCWNDCKRKPKKHRKEGSREKLPISLKPRITTINVLV